MFNSLLVLGLYLKELLYGEFRSSRHNHIKENPEYFMVLLFASDG